MLTNKKVDCTCTHTFVVHYSDGCAADCYCQTYEPIGVNPQVENFLCPICKKVMMNKSEDFYFCYACENVLSERQVLQLLG